MMDIEDDITKSSFDVAEFECGICDKSYSTKKALKIHILCHGSKQYTCDICNVSFYNKAVLTRHIKVHKDDRPYTCDRCGKTYKHLASLVNHKSSHSEQAFFCQICNTSFRYITGLRKHLKVCHSTDQPSCSFCGKEFKYIKDHELHCDSNPRKNKEQFMCKLCKSSFKRQRYLTEHMKYAHSNRQYQCAKCLMKFVHRKTYNIHRKICTPLGVE